MLIPEPDTTSAALVLIPTEAETSECANPPTRLEAAILETVLYSDLFSYPLTPVEIHRFLIGQAVSLEWVEQTLRDSPYLQAALEQDERFVFVRGRAEVVARRLERVESSRKIWESARPYLKWLRAVPFLRTALITGALALDNAPDNDDIDLLLLTTPNRLWLCRACTILIVRLARLRNITLCPNYLLTTEALELDERNLYTAHELAQMRFLFGEAAYKVLLAKNCWAEEFLPNAQPDEGSILPEKASGWISRTQRLGEWLLGGRLGQFLENWERRRKVARFRAMAGDETNFSERVCKGHYNGHAGRTLLALAEHKAAYPWLDEVSS